MSRSSGRRGAKGSRRCGAAGLVVLVAILAVAGPAAALVDYDSGQRTIDGVQLLRDVNDPTAYYYVPQFPRLATKADGSFEILCLKYVGTDGATSGGLFHALVEYTLPPELVTDLEKKLKAQVPNARIVGPVPLMQAVENGAEGMGSFRVVSALLSGTEKDRFQEKVVTSGRAPLMPGSKAVVAALLTKEGATLLWDSLTGPTSDVSVSIHATYEAAVKAYNARVTAEVETVYQHFSRIANTQKDFTRRQLRKVVDDLQREQVLKVEVVDRSVGLGLKPSEMEGVLQVVTDKLVELMFDHQTGWAADPQRETAVEANQILGRQDRGWFSSTFGGSEDTKYYTDDQFVLKDRKDVRHNVFTMNLAKSSTIKVPVDTAGNLGGLYGALKNDPRYFRIVDLARDADLELRTVRFQVDGACADAFQDTLNFVAVNFRKVQPDQPAFTDTVQFDAGDVKAGTTTKPIVFPRLGAAGPEWTGYEYQVRWSLRDGATLSDPKKEGAWIKSADAAVALVPPFEKRSVEIDSDRSLFAARGVVSAVVDVAMVLGGHNRVQKKAVLRSGDAASSTTVGVYHDRDSPMVARVTWHWADGRTVEKREVLDADYLFLVPPEPPPAGGTGGSR
jgi:hypothetical protein